MLSFFRDQPKALICLAQRRLDWTPVADRLAGWFTHDHACALISDGGERGRYSYLTALPAATAELAHDAVGDARDALHAACAFDRGETTPDAAPFTGGVIGMAAFELGPRLENLRRRPFRIEGRTAWPELVLHLYPAVLAFDHTAHTLTVYGRGPTPEAAEAARDQLAALYARTPVLPPDMPPVSGPCLDAPLRSETPDDAHEDKVAALVQQIHAGDLFQANLARGWTGRLREGVTPGQVAAQLHRRGPAPFGGYLRLGPSQRAIVSNSPERFIRLEPDGRMETRPIKGTRPRGESPAADRALAAELLASEKDRAENLMIVDLMRHDLGRVAEIGSVRVTALHALESFANVHHLVSTVTARLREGLTAADLLCATLPAGSISGAPKVQAMKVIAGMEAARGPYCGSLFWIDAGGGMDSNVLIRTLACERDEGGRWLIRAAAGGGIVADSDPLSERLESETKLSLIRAVLEGV
ncbi:anthranilate synthase component I family protein [Asticcacaulis sp. EMRT-3]|uniref:anthranilate synthase component I family protein n=1 Tax=Asticcacaulis sp. EMRT-3 TaxID=3040349 RepID=UPI0024AF2C5C|nr:anthranilate synthase component I family protein [Asticcacaulis sp. EMRT-3]MDI7776028.1 anthranilate synthase component I family protein [Asticcacaulis sp. EMRT-3]